MWNKLKSLFLDDKRTLNGKTYLENIETLLQINVLSVGDDVLKERLAKLSEICHVLKEDVRDGKCNYSADLLFSNTFIASCLVVDQRELNDIKQISALFRYMADQLDLSDLRKRPRLELVKGAVSFHVLLTNDYNVNSGVERVITRNIYDYLDSLEYLLNHIIKIGEYTYTFPYIVNLISHSANIIIFTLKSLGYSGLGEENER